MSHSFIRPIKKLKKKAKKDKIKTIVLLKEVNNGKAHIEDINK